MFIKKRMLNTYMMVCIVGGGHREVVPPLDSPTGLGQSEAFHFLCPWNVPSAHFSLDGTAFRGCNLERARCC